MELEKYTWKGLIIPTLGCLLILGLLQPFGIDHVTEGRFWFIIGECSVVLLVTSLCHLILAHVFRVDFSARKSRYNPFIATTLNYVLSIPFLCLGISAFNSWYDDHWGIFSDWTYFLWPVTYVSIILYIFSIIYLRSVMLKDELDDVKAINALLEARQQKMDEAPVEKPQEETCKLIGTYGNTTLELKPTDIIYIESMANYADICYLQEGETRHKTLRLTLKAIKESLGDCDCLVSCHRAFIVNLNFVITLSKQTTGYSLQLFGIDKPIPVSRTNTPVIKEKLGAL